MGPRRFRELAGARSVAGPPLATGRRPVCARGSERSHRPTAAAIEWLGVGLAGAVLGVGSRLGDGLHGDWAWVANVGAPWLVLAFALGLTARSRRRAARRGAAGLVVAAVAYYGWVVVVQHGAGRHNLAEVAVLWAVVGIAAGTAFGVAGWSWSHGPRLARIYGAGLLSAALVGEATFLLVTEPPGARAVVLGELVAGCVLPWMLLRRPADGLRGAIAAVSLVPAAVLTTAVVLAVAARLVQ